jgi:hypothetical protein
MVMSTLSQGMDWNRFCENCNIFLKYNGYIHMPRTDVIIFFAKKAFFVQNIDLLFSHINFWLQFFTENWRKSQKIVIITLTPMYCVCR